MEEIERSPKMMIAAFKALWPQTFVDQKPPPLKIGISKDILDSGLPKDRPFTAREIQKGLQHYCNLPKYKKGLQKDGRIRIDLDGQPAGQVSPEEAEKAREKLKSMEQAKLDKARAKAEAEAALLAAKEAKKQRRAAERAAKKKQRHQQNRQRQVNVEYRRRRTIVPPKSG